MLVFSGCVSAPKVEADRGGLAGVRRIAIVDLKQPNSAMVQNFGLAMGFGAIGGAAQGAANAANTKSFSAAIAAHVPTLNDTLIATLSMGLKEDGYDVVLVSDQKPGPSADKKTWDFSNVHADADALLCIWAPWVGYISPPQTFKYQPQVGVRVQLTDARTQKILYTKYYFVGYKPAAIAEENLPAPEGPRFKSSDELNQHADQAEDVLIDCGKIGAQRIAADLRKIP